ncbi:MAG: MerR family transcriptional regulator [Planctomycetales bacterium]|nr:MerR family transcriptional regulator [Planctomycetales bacterium]
MASTSHDDEAAATARLHDERVALVGRMASMSRRDATRLIVREGGVCLDEPDATATLIVLGDEELLPASPGNDGDFDAAIFAAADAGKLAIISETELWQRLGLVEPDRKLYTPAMLADLLNVSVSVVRRWRRRGLIKPAREVKRLAYFDFQEVASARRLAELLSAGCSAQTIERKLADLQRYVARLSRPLAQLSVIVEGKQLLLRQGDGLVEPGGQMRLDFDAVRHADSAPAAPSIALPEPTAEPPTMDGLIYEATALEDAGHLDQAIDVYRATLAAAGPLAEVNFALAELLYRTGDLNAARERYYMAIEVDEEYVEARANLGCLLAELGRVDLAIAAFRGALACHEAYPDAHYHLARLLEGVDEGSEAREHWQTFLELAPDSPWAEEARRRLIN